jgi:hypothetical protein
LQQTGLCESKSKILATFILRLRSCTHVNDVRFQFPLTDSRIRHATPQLWRLDSRPSQDRPRSQFRITMWDSWWTKWQWGRFLPPPPPIMINPPLLHTHLLSPTKICDSAN